jgi:hypothetical protein
MQVFVKTIYNKTIVIDIKEKEPIYNIRKRVENISNIKNTKLLFSGKQLNDKKTLYDYNIVNDCTLHSVKKLIY